MTTDLPFDVGGLEGWLREAGLVGGGVRLRRIGDGLSNLTYAVSDDEHSLVVRRPPPPPLPRGANDVLREARIMRALSESAVPVPHVLAIAETSAVMDVPFYVMEHLQGEVATVALPPALDAPAQRRRLGEALIDALAALHAVDWRALGLADLGRPERVLERQLDKLGRLIADEDGALPSPFCALRDELQGTLPVSGPPVLVHGDLRLGNVMLASDAPARIIGVLDWELAAIGDPLADLAYTLATYAVADEPPHALTELSAATLAPGFPTRGQLAGRYAEATGRDVSKLPWYEGMQLFKLAVLFEYNRRKTAAGRGDPYYADPRLVEGLLAAAGRALGLGARPSERSPA